MIQINLKQKLWEGKPCKRRASAEVIASVLLVAITVVGAVILTTFLDETFLASGTGGQSAETTIKTVRLLAYDGRDSTNLLNIQNLDNSCCDGLGGETNAIANPNSAPENGGSDFIVLQIQNQATKSIYVKGINLNGVGHFFDSTNGGIVVDTGVSGGFPDDGMFSIVPADPNNASYVATQNQKNEVGSGQTVNIIVKLGADDPDYDLDQSIRVLMNIGAPSLVDFIIEAGGAQ